MKACQEDGVGRGAQESRRNGAVVHPRAQSGQRRGWGGREFGSGRTQRRCVGVVAAGGVARGDMGEDSLDDLGSLEARDDMHAVDSYTYLVDVLQRISVYPAKQAIELTPRMWKSLFADAPLRSDLGPHHHDPPSH